jgi:sterol desaturase/sphingolipid hydroxylase (fatty acid hydroxylase superfamily)
MPGFLLSHEPLLRLAIFGGILAAMAAWEMLAPRRAFAVGRARRWPNNLAVVVIDTLVIRLAFPVTAIGVAVFAEAKGWGLFNILGAPAWLTIPLAVVLLDLAIYLQHVVFHAVPILWRLHRMHHADLGFDTTTGIRFHPFEIVLSMAIKLAVVLVLGIPAIAILIFEILLNATSLFNHGNVRIPVGIDRLLRWVVVTPDMHRVHHSLRMEETNSNFGFNLPWWDRAFGTYRAQPAAGHDAMDIGLADFRDPADLRIDRMLVQPFRTPTEPHSFGQHEERG